MPTFLAVKRGGEPATLPIHHLRASKVCACERERERACGSGASSRCEAPARGARFELAADALVRRVQRADEHEGARVAEREDVGALHHRGDNGDVLPHDVAVHLAVGLVGREHGAHEREVRERVVRRLEQAQVRALALIVAPHTHVPHAVRPLERAQRVAEVAAGHWRRRDDAALAVPGREAREVRARRVVDAALRALGEEGEDARRRDGHGAGKAAEARRGAALLPVY